MRTVFILGAGFSRPAGLPLMNDFIHMAKDRYAINNEKFQVVKEVDSLISEYANTSRYLKLDLDNIEELLSIFETKRLVENSRNNPFKKLICDLLSELSPKFDSPLVSNTNEVIKSVYENPIENGYFSFICSILGLNIEILSPMEIRIARGLIRDDVSIITFNYDIILESSLIKLDKYSVDIKWMQRLLSEKIIHLHGTIENEDTIMPPSWNKTMPEELLLSWKLAFEKISNAQRIVVIGYSFPQTDSYFDYFLKSALAKNYDLRSVKVFDPNIKGAFEDRLKDKFTLKKLITVGNGVEYIFNSVNMFEYGTEYPVKLNNNYQNLHHLIDA